LIRRLDHVAVAVHGVRIACTAFEPLSDVGRLAGADYQPE